MAEIAQILSLGDLPIAAAGTVVTAFVTDLAGMSAVTFQARLAYGTGGTKVQIYLQTTLDQETTVIDIACITFGAAGGTKVVNLSALTPRLTEIVPTDGALPDDTAVDGILGDRLRLKIVTTGTYAGSTVLSARASVR